MKGVDFDGLEFFNRLSGRLEIELTEAPERIYPNLENLKAPPSAAIESLRLELGMYEGEQFRPLRADELAVIVLRAPEIVLRGEGGTPVRIEATNGDYFAVGDLIAAVEETERQTRAKSEWFGGIDVHHVFFEGIHESENPGVWEIHWGS
jgi:hypothetical protein